MPELKVRTHSSPATVWSQLQKDIDSALHLSILNLGLSYTPDTFNRIERVIYENNPGYMEFWLDHKTDSAKCIVTVTPSFIGDDMSIDVKHYQPAFGV